MTAVKLMGAESAILSKLDQLNTSYFRAGLAQVRMFAVFNPLMELLGSLTIALIVWYGGGAVIQDRVSLGTLVAFITYMQMLLIPIRDLSEKYNQLQGALASVERIYNVLDDDTALPVAAEAHRASAPHGHAEIDFQSVHFGYRDHLKVFEELNLTIPRGQTVTVVGPSGGGKSTLVNLLLRLYDPWEGRVLLQGRDLRSIPGGELARSIVLVSQEIILLASSLEENITLGRTDITPDMLANALEISDVTTWMNQLSEGIRTRIGEGGRQLSQGQRQMLSLARALAGNPRILILDEAFSQIDPESEKLTPPGCRPSWPAALVSWWLIAFPRPGNLNTSWSCGTVASWRTAITRCSSIPRESTPTWSPWTNWTTWLERETDPGSSAHARNVRLAILVKDQQHSNLNEYTMKGAVAPCSCTRPEDGYSFLKGPRNTKVYTSFFVDKIVKSIYYSNQYVDV